MKNWSQFFMQFQLDFKLWICFMVFFLLFRIVFILMFKGQIEKESSLKTVMAALLNGARFDSVVSTLWILIPFCFSLASGFLDSAVWALQVRAITVMGFMIISSIICIITLSYFREFGDQFNHFLFNLIYDDLKATMTTIIKAYKVIEHAMAIALTAICGWYITMTFIQEPFLSLRVVEHYFSSLPVQIGTTVFILLLPVIGARGTLGLGPPLRERHAAITDDKFLNKTILNPYKALWYTIHRQLKLSGPGGIKVFLPDKGVAKAAQLVFSNKEQLDDLDTYMLTHAKGPKGTPPRHIFNIVAESFSAWPLLDRYASLHLADGLKGLAEEGIMIKAFISGSAGTMGTLNTILTNLPDAGITTNYRPTARLPYPSSIAPIFKDLGYKTRFFYGGFLSWQRVGDFCRDQGFEEIYGGGHMGDWAS
jgi:phosphoglycerol transferase MdoB-like AlkP superfamily enzyme